MYKSTRPARKQLPSCEKSIVGYPRKTDNKLYHANFNKRMSFTQ